MLAQEIKHKMINIWNLHCWHTRYQVCLIHGTLHVFLERQAKVCLKVLCNYLVGIEREVIVRCQTVRIKCRSGSPWAFKAGASIVNGVLGRELPDNWSTLAASPVTTPDWGTTIPSGALIPCWCSPAVKWSSPWPGGWSSTTGGIYSISWLITCEIITLLPMCNIVLLNWISKCLQELFSSAAHLKKCFAEDLEQCSHPLRNEM